MALVSVGTVAPSSAARADVTVTPGGSGHICSSYSYIRTNPNVYWQTCSWADDNEVYFTVHFGNASGSTFHVDEVNLSYYRSGQPRSCEIPTYWNHAIASGTSHTRTNKCVENRSLTNGYAYQAVATLFDYISVSADYSDSRSSDSLQVQA